MQNEYLPLDPQIMEDVRNHLGGYNQSSHSQNHDAEFQDAEHEHEHEQHDSDSFQAMLGTNHRGREGDPGNEDLDMLIDQEEDGDAEGDATPDAEGDGDGAIIQLQAEAAARAAEEALRTVGREYGAG